VDLSPPENCRTVHRPRGKHEFGVLKASILGKLDFPIFERSLDAED
jgi:hypothetical protein